jgi:hypothetical protein
MVVEQLQIVALVVVAVSHIPWSCMTVDLSLMVQRMTEEAQTGTREPRMRSPLTRKKVRLHYYYHHQERTGVRQGWGSHSTGMGPVAVAAVAALEGAGCTRNGHEEVVETGVEAGAAAVGTH